MIDFQNVSFSYGEESSGGGIRNVNLTINTGEFVLLTGESGCGKTTITRLVNGLVPHYYEGNLEGDVLLDGKSVSDTPLMTWLLWSDLYSRIPKVSFSTWIRIVN